MIKVNVRGYVIPLGSQQSAGDLGPDFSLDEGSLTIRFGPDVRFGAERNFHPGNAHRTAPANGESYPEDPLTRFSDPQVRLREMDRVGIDVMGVTLHPMLYGYSLDGETAWKHASQQNSALAEYCDADRSRLFFMATLPMQDLPSAEAELERAASTLGAKGVHIGAELPGFDFDDWRINGIWERCCAYDLPVLIHPSASRDAHFGRWWAILGHLFQETVAFSTFVTADVLDRFPTLKIIFTHGGGFLPYQFGRFERMVSGYGLTSRERPRDYLKNIYFDCHIQDILARRFLIDWAGADHILVGDDYGMEPEDDFRLLAELCLDSEAEEKIAGGNAVGLFHLDV
jgi:aminocarboxymuconate-semialdehyde decarboxylase